jgi:glutaredoxin 3
VPRVFIHGRFFGGGDDTAAAARDGRLKALLGDVAA